MFRILQIIFNKFPSTLIQWTFSKFEEIRAASFETCDHFECETSN